MPPPERPKLTEEEGRRALLDHVVEKALLARSKYGDPIDDEAIQAICDDREIVRYPVTIVFDDGPLEPGEFAYPEPVGESPAAGFRLVVHPLFRDRPGVLALAAAYHLVRVNYGDIATREEAELFGATLLGLDVETYYRRLCELSDEVLALGS